MTSNTTTPSKTPTHIAYHVRDTKAGKGYWTRVGSAWPHADGKGLSVQLEVFPLNGRISLRVASEETR